jgi:hypothetical protein
MEKAYAHGDNDLLLAVWTGCEEMPGLRVDEEAGLAGIEGDAEIRKGKKKFEIRVSRLDVSAAAGGEILRRGKRS